MAINWSKDSFKETTDDPRAIIILKAILGKVKDREFAKIQLSPIWVQRLIFSTFQDSRLFIVVFRLTQKVLIV